MSPEKAPTLGRDSRGPGGAGPRGMDKATRRWPVWLRRGHMEALACVCIALGIAMMLQPFVLGLFTWSFPTTLFGTVMFMVVSKFPE